MSAATRCRHVKTNFRFNPPQFIILKIDIMKKHLFLVFLFVSPLVCAQEDMFVYLTTSTIQSTHKGGPDADYSVSEANSHNMLDGYVKSVNPNFNIVCVDTITDLAGNLHYRYALMYDKFIVEDCRFTVHSDGNLISSLSGITLFSDTIETKARISLSNAIEAARNALAAKNHTWNNDSKNTAKENLVIYYEPLKTPELAYKIRCSNIGHYFSYTVYVSAYTGKVLKMRNNIYSAVNNARIYNTKTQNYDVVTITTKLLEDGKYILKDENRNIVTYDGELFDPHNSPIPSISYPRNNYIDNDNSWLSSEFPEYVYNSPNSGLVAHWSAEQTYDFFKTTFNRNGLDGENCLISICNNVAGIGGYNARFSNTNRPGNLIIIGSGIYKKNENTIDTAEHFSQLDVIAHEFGHGVSKHTASFIYEGESGAIEEGYSDIWAACVERYVGNLSDSAIWIMGDKFRLDESGRRNIMNPNSTNQPDTYFGNYWFYINDSDTTGRDFVHTNSSIFSHWFYLLVNGGSGVNDNNDSYNVEGVGFDTAMRIAYNALITEMNEHTNFSHARQTTLRSAAILYKYDPQVYISVRNAWIAVGVESTFAPTQIIGDFGVCDNGSYFINDLPEGAQIVWSCDKYEDASLNGTIQKDKLVFVSGQGTPAITVKRNSNFMQDQAGSRRYAGSVTITATIYYNNHITTTSKNVFANYPITEIDYEKQTNLLGMSVHKFSIDDRILPDAIAWKITKPNGEIVYQYEENSVSIMGVNSGIIRAEVTDTNGCELCRSAEKSIYIQPSISLPQMSYSNPVSKDGMLDIVIDDGIEANDNSVMGNNPTQTYKIEIVSEVFGTVRTLSTTERNAQISMSGLLPGVYFIRLSSGNDMLSTSVLLVQ